MNQSRFNIKQQKSGNNSNIKNKIEEWAKIAYEKYKNYVLNSPDISIILPFEPANLSKENNLAITYFGF